MVRVAGRRVKTFLTSAKKTDIGKSPKRKDQRLDFPKKELLLQNSISETQTIINFFQTAQENETVVQRFKKDQFVQNSFMLPKNFKFKKDISVVNEDATYINKDTSTKIDIDTEQATVTAVTPHRIELCPEIQTSPASALSQLHILITSKKSSAPKARRKLNVNQSANQVLRTNSKDNTIYKNNITGSNHTLTEYFPVRRSIRKTKRTVLEEKQKTLEQCIRNELEEGLEVHMFSGKGRGVVANQFFSKGDFVIEYKGELIDMAEARRREQKYAQDQNMGCYMYYFKHKNVQYCVDATAETGYLGRLVNHSRNGNLITRTISVDGIPRLILIAKEDILAGEEVTYDYGDRSKESLKYHPWLAT